MMTDSPAELVRTFNREMGIWMPEKPAPGRLEESLLHRKATSMLSSEFAELQQSWGRGDLSGVGRELADIVYIAYGIALELGLDLDAKLVDVHEANLTRKSEEGTVQRREDGKIQKGKSYLPPAEGP